MDLELIINKHLRKNFRDALKLQNANETKEFITNLDERDRHELLSYMDFAYMRRCQIGRPIKEYFLMHYNDYITEADATIFKRADQFLNIVFAITAVTILVILLV